MWREHLLILKSHLNLLATTMAMPITPKLHVMTVHFDQWVDRNCRSMGRERESSGEALHHLWKRLIEGKGEVKDKDSEAYVIITFRSMMKLVADNV